MDVKDLKGDNTPMEKMIDSDLKIVAHGKVDGVTCTIHFDTTDYEKSEELAKKMGMEIEKIVPRKYIWHPKYKYIKQKIKNKKIQDYIDGKYELRRDIYGDVVTPAGIIALHIRRKEEDAGIELTEKQLKKLMDLMVIEFQDNGGGGQIFQEEPQSNDNATLLRTTVNGVEKVAVHFKTLLIKVKKDSQEYEDLKERSETDSNVQFIKDGEEKYVAIPEKGIQGDAGYSLFIEKDCERIL